MEWSPDKEVFVIATGKGTLLEMTKDFDVLAEKELEPEVVGEGVEPLWGNRASSVFLISSKTSNLRNDGCRRLGQKRDAVPRF